MRSKKKIAIVVTIIIISAMGFLCIKKLKSKTTIEDLVNISSLSQEFMDNYLSDVKKIKDEDKENLLIVTSKKQIKNTYGASKIISAPNNQYYLQYESEDDKDIALKKFNDNKQVLSVQENLIYHLSNETIESNYNSWGVQKSGFDHAKNVIEDSGRAENINVAIIDSGCDMELFNENYNGKIVDTYNIYDSNSESMYDDEGHGTHIAGTIAESTPSNVKIIPIKITNGVQMTTVDIISAINYIVYNNKANVVNMSFGTYSYDDSLYLTIEAAEQKNIICVAAAGNKNTSDLPYPASFDNTISISAVDSNMRKAEFSNYGDYVTFASPGVDILSINGVASGTSMATPHAVSAVAILKSLKTDLNFDDTIDLLKTYAIDLGPNGYDEYFGYGFISLSDIEICENHDTQTCDKHGMFKTISPSRIEVTDSTLTKYNYGSITNILNFELTIYGTDGDSDTKPLWDLDNIEISNYDPYTTDEQEITIKYLNFTTKVKIKNPSNYDLAWEYKMLADNTAEITKYKDHDTQIDKLYFPETLDGHKVVSILDSTVFDNSRDVQNYKEIYLPNNINKIGNGAFTSFINLYLVTSDADSIYVGANAFMDLNYLKEFNGTVKFDENSSNAFYNNTFLEKIVISSDTEKIPDYALTNTSIEDINLSESITTIGDYAFSNTKLKKIYIPSSITSIGDKAFGNKELVEIVVSEDNGYYDSRNNCNAIIETNSNKLIVGTKETIIPETVTTIGRFAFSGTNIEQFTVPEGVTTIEYGAFRDCEKLEKLELPKSLESMDNIVSGSGTKTIYSATVFWVYNNSYAHKYAVDNVKAYKIRDITQNEWTYVSRSTSWTKMTYYEFEQVDKDDLKIVLYYNNYEISETLKPDEFSIEYQTGADSLRYNDSIYTVRYNTKDGFNNLRFTIPVTVNEKNYDIPIPIPTDLTALVGQKLSEVILPHGFEWMDGDIVLEKAGNQSFKARYVPDDLINEEIVENIDINVLVSYPEIYTVTFISNNNVGTPYTQEFIENKPQKLTKNRFTKDFYKFKEWNTSSDGSGISYTDEQEIIIDSNLVLYAIWEFDTPYKIDYYTVDEEKKYIDMIEINTDTEEFIKHVRPAPTYSMSADNVLVNDKWILYTGGKTTFYYNGSIVAQYTNIIRGDVNGDAKVNYLDYVKIYNHIYKTKHPDSDKLALENEYLIAADISKDDNVNYMDYVMVYNKIKELKEETE